MYMVALEANQEIVDDVGAQELQDAPRVKVEPTDTEIIDIDSDEPEPEPRRKASKSKGKYQDTVLTKAVRGTVEAPKKFSRQNAADNLSASLQRAFDPETQLQRDEQRFSNAFQISQLNSLNSEIRDLRAQLAAETQRANKLEMEVSLQKQFAELTGSSRHRRRRTRHHSRSRSPSSDGSVSDDGLRYRSKPRRSTTHLSTASQARRENHRQYSPSPAPSTSRHRDLEAPSFSPLADPAAAAHLFPTDDMQPASEMEMPGPSSSALAALADVASSFKVTQDTSITLTPRRYGRFDVEISPSK